MSGPEFFSLKHYVLVITKEFHGLRTSGLYWNERLADFLRNIGFQPCKMEPEFWMRRVDSKGYRHYEYIEVCVNDLRTWSKSPQLIVCALTKNFIFKLKFTGLISYYLGCDFIRDGNNNTCLSPHKCMDKISDSYVSIFISKPKSTYHSPLKNVDNPELDTTNFLDADCI